MKKVLLLSAIILLGTCFFVGCSSDVDDGLSVESQLNIVKQKYRYYAQLYGVEGLQFIDKQLLIHLNLTDEQIEQDMIHAALVAGKLDTDVSKIRKKFRTRSAGEDEGGSGWSRVEVTGSFSDETIVGDTMKVSLKVHFCYNEHGHVSITDKTAKVRRRYKCDDQTCKKWHEDTYEHDATMALVLVNSVVGSITKEVNSEVKFTFNYEATISSNNADFYFFTRLRNTKEGKGTVNIIN